MVLILISRLLVILAILGSIYLVLKKSKTWLLEDSFSDANNTLNTISKQAKSKINLNKVKKDKEKVNKILREAN